MNGVAKIDRCDRELITTHMCYHSLYSTLPIPHTHPAMATSAEPSSSNSTKNITVYLTGFGPFARVQDNPSAGISSSFLPAGSTVITFTAPDGVDYNISIHPHPEALRVCYKDVDKVVDELWETREWDYILHLGAGLSGCYKVETIAHDKGYVKADVDGLDADGNKGRGKAEVDRVPGSGEVYATGLDVGYLADFARDHAVSLEPWTFLLNKLMIVVCVEKGCWTEDKDCDIDKRGNVGSPLDGDGQS